MQLAFSKIIKTVAIFVVEWFLLIWYDRIQLRSSSLDLNIWYLILNDSSEGSPEPSVLHIRAIFLWDVKAVHCAFLPRWWFPLSSFLSAYLTCPSQSSGLQLFQQKPRPQLQTGSSISRTYWHRTEHTAWYIYYWVVSIIPNACINTKVYIVFWYGLYPESDIQFVWKLFKISFF